MATLENYEFLNQYASFFLKVHRTGTYTLALADTWTDMEFNLKISNESSPEFHYYDEGGGSEDTSIIVCDTDGVFWIGGCLHSYWDNATGGTHYIASRIVYSDDDGASWNEARCLQSMESTTRTQADYLTHPYLGTLYVESGWWLKLQTRVDDTDLELRGSAVFDNPVSATLGIYGVKQGVYYAYY